MPVHHRPPVGSDLDRLDHQRRGDVHDADRVRAQVADIKRPAIRCEGQMVGVAETVDPFGHPLDAQVHEEDRFALVIADSEGPPGRIKLYVVRTHIDGDCFRRRACVQADNVDCLLVGVGGQQQLSPADIASWCVGAATAIRWAMVSVLLSIAVTVGVSVLGTKTRPRREHP